MPLTIPTQGLSDTEVMDVLNDLRRKDADWERGRTFSLVYYAGERHQRLLERAYAMFSATNALNPMAFQSLRRMEAEVIRMTADMLHGDRQSVGTMTSGGTESILMACKAARDRRPLGRGVKPNIVAPETIHVAFDKAASYFGLEMRYARLRADRRADVKDMVSLIDSHTVLLAASAPQYPHGVVDPIDEIGEVAVRKKIPFHVDACVGGFVLPWIEKLGHPLPRWDFRVPGVTSISADLHKYGLSAKGASTIVYRDMSYLRPQFFVSTDWPGGIYASPSIAGTRSGGAIAAAWTAMVALGEAGYLEHTKKALEATRILIDGIGRIPEVEVMGEPDATVLAWRATKASKLDTYVIADRLEDRGWLVDRQQNPSSIHCTVTSNHLGMMNEYVEAIREAVEYVKAHPEIESRGNAAMYGMMAKVPFRGMVKKGVLDVMEKLYGPDAAAPKVDVLGSEESDGMVIRLLKTYGNRALGLLDRVEDARRSLGLSKGRRR